MPLTQQVLREYSEGPYSNRLVESGAVIYRGAAVGVDPTTGYARPLQSGDKFGGFSENWTGQHYSVDNSDGGDGEKNVQTRDTGKVSLEIAGASLADLLKPVFATDDNTFNLTAGVEIGKIVEIEQSDWVIVKYSI